MSVVVNDRWSVPRQTVPKFAAVGVVSTLLILVIIVLLKSIFTVGDVPANACGYAAGLACSFVLGRRWTFSNDDSVSPPLARFLGAFVVAYMLNIIAVLMLIQFGLNNYLAHVAGMPLYAVAFYLGCRHFVFPQQSIRVGDAGPPSAGYTPRSEGLAPSTDALYRSALGWFIVTIVVAASMLFYRLGSSPINLWDESRAANNALEMMRTGLSLVTTFGGAPDHWATKPPLLIWSMSIAMQLFGPNEWAVRLPSVLAALATVGIIFAFCALHLRKPFVGFIAAMVLLGARGYMTGDHGARNGDYESMLMLTTTGYVLTGYLYLYGRPANRRTWLALCTLGILFAFMTKTVQGMIFLPAMLLHAAAHRRLLEMARSPSIYAAVALLFVVCVGYYVAREQVDPGYISAALANDFMRYRIENPDDPPHGPLWYLIDRVDRFYWLVPGPLIAGYLAWRGQGEVRRVSGYLGLVSLFYVAVVSFSATKILYYVTPVYTVIAIAVALGTEAAIARAATRVNWSAATMRLAVAVVSATLVARTTITHVEHLISEPTEVDRYSLFLRSPAFQNTDARKFIVVHPGFRVPTHLGYYVAPTLFYVNVLRAEGRSIEIQHPSKPIPAGFDLVVACGSTAEVLAAGPISLQPVVTAANCGLYQIVPR